MYSCSYCDLHQYLQKVCHSSHHIKRPAVSFYHHKYIMTVFPNHTFAPSYCLATVFVFVVFFFFTNCKLSSISLINTSSCVVSCTSMHSSSSSEYHSNDLPSSCSGRFCKTVSISWTTILFDKDDPLSSG